MSSPDKPRARDPPIDFIAVRDRAIPVRVAIPAPREFFV